MLHFWIMEVAVVLLAVSFHFNVSTDSSSDDIVDVIVVGAGLTGLSAARELKMRKPGARVMLIEAKGQVGGRVRARLMKTADGESLIDIGAQFVSPSPSALTSLASQLGCSLFRQANCGARTLHLRGIRHKREADLLTTIQSFRDVLESPELVPLSSQSVHEFVVEKHVSPITTDTANRLLQTLYDSPDVSTSIVHLLLATASENATIADLLSRFGHGQGLLMKGGLHSMIRALAKNLKVQLNEIVTDIEEVGSVVRLKTTSQYYIARQVIVTVPPVVTSAIRFSPPLPAEFLRFIESYAPTGRAYYFTLTYLTPFWRGQGRSGQLIYTNSLGPIVWLTTFDVALPTMCDGTGATGVLWGIAHFSQQMTTSQRHAAYVDVVTRSLGDYGQLPLDISDENFMSDPFCQGSIAILPPKFDVAGLRFIRGINHHGEKVVFASAEYSNTSMGLMNGAVVSGQLAGASVAEKLLDTEGETEEDSEVANMVHLNDEIDNVGENHDKSDSLEEETVKSNFVYQTSTHYPSTTPADTNTFKHLSLGNTNSNVDKSEAEGYAFDSNMDVEPESVRSSFVYDTSSHYPSTQPIETSTFKHFSSGNADPVEEFVPPSLPLDPTATTAATTTTTKRTTFTPVDSFRTTILFEYNTSTVHSTPPVDETSIFEHVSFGSSVNGTDEYAFDSNVDAESESVQSPFAYDISSQYPPTQPIETSTFKHFSFGNADPVEEFVPPSLPFDPLATTAATTTTTERTTFTPVDPSRTTIPFEYETSTVNSIPPAIETGTFKHFSFGNSESESDQYAFDRSMDVESESVQTPFVYDTSSQYPSTQPIETSTFKHFSFGNADPVEEFVPPSPPFDPLATTAATTTTTERTTFTPVDPSRTTIPFVYETSTVNSIPLAVETSTFEHFSFGNSLSATVSHQQDIESSDVIDDELVRQLQEVIDMVPTSSKLQVAIRLSSILRSLLVSIKSKR